MISSSEDEESVAEEAEKSDQSDISSEEENLGSSFKTEIEVLLIEEKRNSEDNCMLSKAMWVIENIEKTEGRQIELNKPFRLLSLAKQEYLSCLFDPASG